MKLIQLIPRSDNLETAARHETDYFQVESELKNSHFRNQIFTFF